jgi:hypothetical protein
MLIMWYVRTTSKRRIKKHKSQTIEYSRLLKQFNQVCLPLRPQSNSCSVFYLSEVGFIVLQDICIILRPSLQQYFLTIPRHDCPCNSSVAPHNKQLGLIHVWAKRKGKGEGSFTMLAQLPRPSSVPMNHTQHLK